MMEDSIMEIPKFLIRKRKRGRPKKLKQTLAPSDKYIEWDKIKQEKYGTRYVLQLGDEAPKIGSGSRIVYVKEGRKWAHMTYHVGDPADTSTRVRKKFPMKQWLDMKASHERFVARHERKLKKLRKKANETNT